MKNTLIPILVSLVLFTAVTGVYVFMVGAVNTNVGRMERALADADALSARDTLLSGSAALLDDIKPLSARLASTLIQNGNEVRAIEILESIGTDERVDVSIAKVEAAPLPGAQHHERLVVTLSAKGSYARLARFLAALEAYPVALRLESVSLEKSGTSSWFATLTLSMLVIKP